MQNELNITHNQENILIIPCSGIERLTGQLSTSIALELVQMGREHSKNIVIEPSFAQISVEEENVQDLLKNKSICVLNGCGKKCVSKLCETKELRPDFVFNIPQSIKGKGFSPKGKTSLTGDELNIATETAKEIYLKLYPQVSPKKDIFDEKFQFLPNYEQWQKYLQAKFEFKVPNNKSGLYFTWNDAWVYMQDGKAVVGISDYLQQNMSDIVIIDLPEIGSKAEQLESLASIESTKTVIDLLSPFTGNVVQVNKALIEEPDIINREPYTNGWICVIEPSTFDTELEDLMTPLDYFAHMKEKIEDEIK
ncbi:Glycine cleavage system H protein [Candidatus Lokiarchaeum ossiferum]|uniref:Glycine cleavage system H protein n=1 Tax=Candidatus Lokiarchaeum ossiferum TaxID=2951803 RepID=A0ABY6HXN8_9ARCH|nr:Glycine cleavage system H protein [Candidatus Lokiarchaeum sp. B-35]